MIYWEGIRKNEVWGSTAVYPKELGKSVVFSRV
jgi:hypothetical protein